MTRLPGGAWRWVVAAAMLAGAFLAVSGGAIADEGVPPPAGAGSTKLPRCVPGPAHICGRGTLPPGTAATRLISAAGRRGLGMTTVGGGAGRRAAATLRAAIGRSPTNRAQQSELRRSAPARTRRSTAATTLAPSILDRVSTRVVARRGRIRDTRTFRWDAAVERCPDPGPPGNATGRARLVAKARLSVEVDEPRGGGVTVRTIVTLEAKVDSQATSSNRAELSYVGDLSKGRTPITATRQTLVIRNGTSRRAGPTAVADMTADLLAPTVSVTFRSEDFDTFIARAEAQESGEPDPGADGPILGPAWKTLGKEFAQMVASRSWALARLAEQHWRSPNRCLTLDFDGPAKLRPGQRVELTGTPAAGERTATVRQLLGDFVGAGTWTSLRPSGGATIESLVPRLPLPEGSPWIALTAPSRHWRTGAGPGFDMTLATKAGIARFTRTYAEGLPDRFAGTIHVHDVQAGLQDSTWTSDVTYTLVEDVPNPDGTRNARYTLTGANVTAFDDQVGAECFNRATGTGGSIRFGDLELQLAADGSATYGFVHDVGLTLDYVPQGQVPPCVPTFSGLGVAFLNARTGTNALRPAGPDLTLSQAATTDLSANAIPGKTITASWDLLPS